MEYLFSIVTIMQSTREFDFEFVFTTFYKPLEEIHACLQGTTDLYPAKKEQEKQLKRIAALPNTFGFKVELDIERISPLLDLKFPFDKPFFDNKYFCRFIHPNYLIPFLIFARFAYQVASTANLSCEQIYESSYRIPVPLKLPGHEHYSWYIQKAYGLALNQHGQVISHLNLYEFDSICLPMKNGEIENRFIEATLLVDNNLNGPFQYFMKERINQYLVEIFQKQYKQWKMIELLKQDSSISNKAMAEILRLTEETVNSYNKDILHKLRNHLGYQFISIREAIHALTNKGFL